MEIGITAIEYALPGSSTELEALAAAGLLENGADRLRQFGFERAYISREPVETLAAEAVSRLLENHALAPESVDALFFASALPAGHAINTDGNGFLHGFNYPATRLQYDFGLLNATVVGVSQAGCLGLMRAVSAAADLLRANPAARRALCVSSDALPPGAPREILYNLISDGACALLVEKSPARNRLVAARQITKGYYWDCVARRNEIVAAYFPTAQGLIRDTLAQAGLRAEEIDWVIPHNVSLRSWEILLCLLGFPREKLFADNIAAKGHVIAADNWINLKDATDAGLLRRGDKLLLFNFGFGANWGCLLVEH